MERTPEGKRKMPCLSRKGGGKIDNCLLSGFFHALKRSFSSKSFCGLSRDSTARMAVSVRGIGVFF